jgi:hypothetical protein
MDYYIKVSPSWSARHVSVFSSEHHRSEDAAHNDMMPTSNRTKKSPCHSHETESNHDAPSNL